MNHLMNENIPKLSYRVIVKITYFNDFRCSKRIIGTIMSYRYRKGPFSLKNTDLCR